MPKGFHSNHVRGSKHYRWSGGRCIHGAIHCRADAVIRMFADRGVRLLCLGTTKEGYPRNPLYVAGCTTPKEYTPCGQES